MKKFLFFILTLLLMNKIVTLESYRKEKQIFSDEKLFKEKLIKSIEGFESEKECFLKNKDILVEYILSLDIYYKYFEKDTEMKKKEYKKLIDYLENLLKKDNSPKIYYCLSILYGRYVETSNIWDAVKMNIPKRIKNMLKLLSIKNQR